MKSYSANVTQKPLEIDGTLVDLMVQMENYGAVENW